MIRNSFFAVVTVFLLLGGIVSAETPHRLDSLIDYVYLEVYGNANVSTVNDTVAIAAINRAVELVSKSMPAYERWDTVTTNKYTSLYALNSDYIRAFASYRFIDSVDGGPASIYPLQQIQPDSMYLLRQDGKAESATDSDPRYFATFAKQVMFYPHPAKACTIIIGYYAEAPMLDSLTDEIPDDFEGGAAVIEEAAKILRLKARGQ